MNMGARDELSEPAEVEKLLLTTRRDGSDAA